GSLSVFQSLVMIAVFVFVVAGTILVTTGQRRIPVQYPRQVKGRQVYGGGRNYLPLRVNQAGVIPIIFASSLLMLPGMVVGNIQIPVLNTVFMDWLRYDGIPYNVIYCVLIVFF